MTQEHTSANVQKQVYVTELNTPRELLLLIFYISQSSVMTHIRCGGKYVTILVANLLLSQNSERLILMHEKNYANQQCQQ